MNQIARYAGTALTTALLGFAALRGAQAQEAMKNAGQSHDAMAHDSMRTHDFMKAGSSDAMRTSSPGPMKSGGHDAMQHTGAMAHGKK